MSDNGPISGSVSIRCERGVVWVEAPEIFTNSRSPDCGDFIERIFAVAEVQGIEIDHSAGTAKLNCVSSPRDVLLAKLVEALHNPAPADVSAPIRSLLALSSDRRVTHLTRSGAGLSPLQILEATLRNLQMRFDAIALMLVRRGIVQAE